MRTGGLCLHNRVLGVSIQVLHWMLTYIGNWILVLDSVCFGRASMVAFMACARPPCKGFASHLDAVAFSSLGPRRFCGLVVSCCRYSFAISYVCMVTWVTAG